MRALALLAALLLTGCVQPPEAADPTPTATPDLDAPEARLTEWSGRVLTSAGEGFMHFRPTEDVLWPLEQSGVLVEFPTVPEQMEVALSWEGPGEFMIMLHSHKEHGTNVYREHITELDAENPKCLRVPTEDLAEGVWQVMIHSRGAQMTAFTLSVRTVGGESRVVEGDRHGHWLQDGAFEVEERAIEACALA